MLVCTYDLSPPAKQRVCASRTSQSPGIPSSRAWAIEGTMPASRSGADTWPSVHRSSGDEGRGHTAHWSRARSYPEDTASPSMLPTCLPIALCKRRE